MLSQEPGGFFQVVQKVACHPIPALIIYVDLIINTPVLTLMSFYIGLLLNNGLKFRGGKVHRGWSGGNPKKAPSVLGLKSLLLEIVGEK